MEVRWMSSLLRPCRSPAPVHIRQMRVGDVPAVRRLERRCLGTNQGPAAMLRAFLADPFCGGIVAAATRSVVGHLLFHLDIELWEVRICQFTVHPDYRRRGVGSRLLRWTTSHVPPGSGITVRTSVNERNLDAQLFLRANRFRVDSVHKGGACGGDEDLYVFVHAPDLP
jgi:ribosomal protein S18 acetylase RimI-like enzyme